MQINGQKSHLEFQYCKTLIYLASANVGSFLYLDLLAEFKFSKTP